MSYTAYTKQQLASALGWARHNLAEAEEEISYYDGEDVSALGEVQADHLNRFQNERKAAMERIAEMVALASTRGLSTLELDVIYREHRDGEGSSYQFQCGDDVTIIFEGGETLKATFLRMTETGLHVYVKEHREFIPFSTLGAMVKELSQNA